MEIHPDDAKPYGIESGNIVRMTNEDVPVQVGGFEFKSVDELSLMQFRIATFNLHENLRRWDDRRELIVQQLQMQPPEYDAKPCRV